MFTLYLAARAAFPYSRGFCQVTTTYLHSANAQCDCTVRIETELFSAVDIDCLRPEGWLDRGTGKLFLPFDDDPVSSLILSKAFLLADDTAITDESIARQIGGS